MNIEFNNILIPVDFSINTEIAIKKATELVKEKGAVIHLMHVLPPVRPFLAIGSCFSNLRAIEKGHRKTAEYKLTQCKYSIAQAFGELDIKIHVVKGNTVQHQVTALAKKVHPQLIIIGKHTYHSWFWFLNAVSPARLAKMTNCPVLTVKKGSLQNKIKTIVFPVQAFVPNRTIDLLISLTRRYHARVYLVMLVDVSNKSPDPLYSAFIDTYRTLKANLNSPIEHIVLHGSDLSKEALHFAGYVNADMIFLNHETDAGVSLFSGRPITDMIRGDSKLEVLSAGA